MHNFFRFYDFRIVLLTFLSILGVAYLFQYFSIGFFSRRFNKKPEIVIIIRNAQEKIEGIVEDFYRQGVCNWQELWIIDRGSTDETPRILEKLSYRHSGLKVLLLPEIPLEQCYMEVCGYITSPAVLLLDGNRLNYKELLFMTNILQQKKYIEMGLKYYKN